MKEDQPTEEKQLTKEEQLRRLLTTFESLNKNNSKEDTQEIKLDAIGSWKATKHAVEKKDILAMIAALGSERSLLLTGAPGVGKSHLARVAASITKRFFISTVIKPDDEIGDLLWKIDHTQRLSDAQFAGASQKEFTKELKDYIRPGAIWHAFEEPSSCYKSDFKPSEQEANYNNGVVLLIDEIDKASVALQNSLLEVLGNMSFDVPLSGETIESRDKPPLIILTSNGDVSLPAPLLRRCVCHEVKLPSARKAFIQRMKLIAKAQMGEKYNGKVAKECAKLIFKQRNARQSPSRYKSGASEFVDILHALQAIAPDKFDEQVDIHLDNISRYFLK